MCLNPTSISLTGDGQFYIFTYRIQQVKSFEISGVDYAGQITLTGTRGRRTSVTSDFICLPVYTTTKVIRFESNSDLSRDHFSRVSFASQQAMVLKSVVRTLSVPHSYNLYCHTPSIPNHSRTA